MVKLRFKSIKSKMLVMILPVTIISMLMLSSLSYITAKQIIDSEINEKMKYQTNSVIENISKALDKHSKIPLILAKTVGICGKNLSEKDYENLVKSYAESNDETFGSGVWYEPFKYKSDVKFFGPYGYKKDGVVTYTEEYSKVDYTSSDWYKQGKNIDKDLSWSEPYEDEVANVTMITTTVPIVDDKKNFIGVTTADIDLSRIQEMIRNIKVGESGRAFLVNKDGIYLSDIDEEKNMKVNISNDTNESISSISKEILENESGVGYFNDSNGKNMIFYSKVPNVNWKLVLSIPEKELLSPLESLSNKVLITMTGTIIVIILIVILIVNNIKNRISGANKLAESIASGDLTNRIEVTNNDELGVMAVYLNKMNDNLKNIIKSVSDGLEQVVATSEELTASAGQTREAADQIAVSIQEIANGSDLQSSSYDIMSEESEQVFKGVDKIANDINTATNSSITAYNKAFDGNDVIIGTINQMNEINSKVYTSSKMINSLGEKSSKIGEIISLITDISSRTNLLALNAAIEAARAGEQGKGFAVVADEIRKLAEQSANASNNISSIINEIQNEISFAITSMDEGNKAVDEGMNLVENAGESFKEILSEIENVSNNMKSVSGVIDSVLSSTKVMVKSIDENAQIPKQTALNSQSVAASSEEQSALMQEVSHASEELSNMAFELQSDLNKFKL
ncbi:methyl-accepting chemotaxis protein [Clostridium sp. UBA6640]|uniref:methyl-accepting chemotaxis protein n=1 Tax=Clostridium sp. UBA6640 TaxID=1946370 RepID=UPI0025C04FFE|nr:methyl-accepting chemotaxis protein [Clostridium sp. UBA6640]